MFECPRCLRKFCAKTQVGTFRKMRTDPRHIVLALTLITRFKMTYREAAALLYEVYRVRRTHVAILFWVHRYGPRLRRLLRVYKVRFSRRWHADALEMKVHGKKAYLWVARDSRHRMVEATMTRRKNAEATTRFFRNARRKAARMPRQVVMDKCPSLRKGKKIVLPRARFVHGHIGGRITNAMCEGYFGGNLRTNVERRRGFKRFGAANRYLQVYQVMENLRYQTVRPFHEALLSLLRSL